MYGQSSPYLPVYLCHVPSTFTSITPTAGSGNLRPEEIVSYQLGYHGWSLNTGAEPGSICVF
jgi:hypothetical protein